jgi:hypothetical protein
MLMRYASGMGYAASASGVSGTPLVRVIHCAWAAWKSL